MSSRITFLLGWLAFVTLLSAEPASNQNAESFASSSYRLNFGDRLAVNVFGEPELCVQQLIDHHGLVRLPLIGEVRVAGCTMREAESLIEKNYFDGEMLKAPQVTLAMVAYAPREVMVLGAVRSPGAFDFPPDTVSLDIRDVLARQGGFTPVAKSDAVALTRRQTDGQETTITVNVERMMSGRAKKQGSLASVMVYPGDRIFVPERLF